MSRVPLRLALVLAVGVAGSSGLARADEDYEHANDLFGRAVAIDGDWAAVGAIGDNTAAFDAGAIYMYERTGAGWALHSRLVPADSDGGTWLGNALALAGDTLIAGSTVSGTNARRGGRGAAHIYVRAGDGWREQAQLRLDAAVVEDGFGAAVALAGDDAAIVSDHAIVDGAYQSPRVHLYHRDGDEWRASSVIEVEPTGDPVIALSGEMLAVGTGRTSAGVRLYRRDGDGWSAAGTIDGAAGGALSLSFGEHLAVDGDTLAVSDDLRVALFARDGDAWTLQGAVEIADDGASHVQRGAPLALRDDRLAVAVQSPARAAEEVHLFARTDAGWAADGVVAAADAGQSAPWWTNFGGGVALAGDELLVGAWSAGAPPGEQSGVVHVYRRQGARRWDETQVLAPAEPPAGCGCRSGARDLAPLCWLALAPICGRRRRTR